MFGDRGKTEDSGPLTPRPMAAMFNFSLSDL